MKKLLNALPVIGQVVGVIGLLVVVYVLLGLLGLLAMGCILLIVICTNWEIRRDTRRLTNQITRKRGE